MKSTSFPSADLSVLEQIVAEPRFRKLTTIPTWAFPEIAIVVGAWATVLGAAALHLDGRLPYLAAIVMSALAFYAVFTPLHDATHRSVSGNRRINDAIGNAAGFLLLPGFTTKLYRYLHLEHHRYSGEKGHDPDDFLVTAPYPLCFLVWAFVDVHWGVWYAKRLRSRPAGEQRRFAATIGFTVLWHGGWLLSPWAAEFLLLWVVPQRLGLMLLAYLFAHIQHPDEVEQREHPFQATRMMRGGRLVRWALLGQSEHLMHHMFPGIPYYRYDDAWRAAEPHLRDREIVWQWPFQPLRMPEHLDRNRSGTRTLRVTHVEDVSEEVRSFVLEPLEGEQLPGFEPGAHIDVHVAPGIVRQYSLCGDPADPDRWRIAVKREDPGRGGSRRIHEEVQAGTTLEVGGPRNHFRIPESATRVRLVAGGIGITPLLSMARALHSAGTGFTLDVCARNRAVLPFAEELRRVPWADRVRFHLDDDPPTKFDAKDVPEWGEGDVLMLCGPTGFMNWIIDLARSRGWPDRAIRTETFVAIDRDHSQDRPFEVVLARSGRSVPVGADESALDAVQEAGVPVPASCTQGLCGACLTPVLEGEVDHRDTILSKSEHQEGRQMTLCVSRAAGDRIVLDL